MRLIFVERALKGPKRHAHAQGEHDVWNLYARKKKESYARSQDYACVETCDTAECPSTISPNEPGQENRGESHRNTRRPVVHAKNAIRGGNEPVDQRRFFEIRHAIQAGDDPIAGGPHVPGN